MSLTRQEKAPSTASSTTTVVLQPWQVVKYYLDLLNRIHNRIRISDGRSVLPHPEEAKDAVQKHGPPKKKQTEAPGHVQKRTISTPSANTEKETKSSRREAKVLDNLEKQEITTHIILVFIWAIMVFFFIATFINVVFMSYGSVSNQQQYTYTVRNTDGGQSGVTTQKSEVSEGTKSSTDIIGGPAHASSSGTSTGSQSTSGAGGDDDDDEDEKKPKGEQKKEEPLDYDQQQRQRPNDNDEKGDVKPEQPEGESHMDEIYANIHEIPYVSPKLIKEDMKALENLRSQGYTHLTPFQVPGDGNCFYYSLSLARFGTTNYASLLRELIAEDMRDNPGILTNRFIGDLLGRKVDDGLRSFIISSSVDGDDATNLAVGDLTDLEGIIRRRAQNTDNDGIYAGLVEVVYAAHLLNIEINLVILQQNRLYLPEPFCSRLVPIRPAGELAGQITLAFMETVPGRGVNHFVPCFATPEQPVGESVMDKNCADIQQPFDDEFDEVKYSEHPDGEGDENLCEANVQQPVDDEDAEDELLDLTEIEEAIKELKTANEMTSRKMKEKYTYSVRNTDGGQSGVTTQKSEVSEGSKGSTDIIGGPAHASSSRTSTGSQSTSGAGGDDDDDEDEKKPKGEQKKEEPLDYDQQLRQRRDDNDEGTGKQEPKQPEGESDMDKKYADIKRADDKDKKRDVKPEQPEGESDMDREYADSQQVDDSDKKEDDKPETPSIPEFRDVNLQDYPEDLKAAFQLRRHGFDNRIPHSVDQDGDCFFRSLSLALYGNQSINAGVLRSVIARGMTDHPELLTTDFVSRLLNISISYTTRNRLIATSLHDHADFNIINEGNDINLTATIREQALYTNRSGNYVGIIEAFYAAHILNIEITVIISVQNVTGLPEPLQTRSLTISPSNKPLRRVDIALIGNSLDHFVPCSSAPPLDALQEAAEEVIKDIQSKEISKEKIISLLRDFYNFITLHEMRGFGKFDSNRKKIDRSNELNRQLLENMKNLVNRTNNGSISVSSQRSLRAVGRRIGSLIRQAENYTDTDVSNILSALLMLPEPECADKQMAIAKLIQLSDGKMLEGEGASRENKKKDVNSTKVTHAEKVYIDEASDKILKLAINKSCAIILTSKLSPCYNQQECVHDIVEMIRTSYVPHIVIYYYPYKGELDSVRELSRNKIAVFQVIGDHLYFVNRMEIFKQNSHVEFDKFLKWLEKSLTKLGSHKRAETRKSKEEKKSEKDEKKKKNEK